MNLVNHYRQLLFFLLHRFEGDNYLRMQDYFAELLLDDIERFVDIQGKQILDIGGSSGQFCNTLHRLRGVEPTNVDPAPHGNIWNKVVKAGVQNMPFENEYADIILFRGVMEHIKPTDWEDSFREMARCLKPGGIVYCVIPPWYSFHAGHEVKPFHYFPFKIAKKLRELVTRKKVAGNSYEDIQLYKVTFSQAQKHILKSGLKILDTRDVHFRFHFLTKVPLIREFMIPAVAFIARK